MKNSATSGPRDVVVTETPIELCQFLKFAGLSESGGAAKQSIAENLVEVNGVLETRKRRKLAAGDQVTFEGQTIVVRVLAVEKPLKTIKPAAPTKPVASARSAHPAKPAASATRAKK